MKYYHIKLIMNQEKIGQYKNYNPIVGYDFDFDTLMDEIIVPYVKNSEFCYAGVLYDNNDISKMIVVESNISYDGFERNPSLAKMDFWTWLQTSRNGNIVTTKLFNEAMNR